MPPLEPELETDAAATAWGCRRGAPSRRLAPPPSDLAHYHYGAEDFASLHFGERLLYLCYGDGLAHEAV